MNISGIGNFQFLSLSKATFISVPHSEEHLLHSRTYHTKKLPTPGTPQEYGISDLTSA